MKSGAFFGGQPILLLFAVIALGFLLGEVRFPGGFRFGVAAVLFVGLGVGFIWPAIAFPAAFAPLGLALFVYCLGLQAGPGFLRSFPAGWVAPDPMLPLRPVCHSGRLRWALLLFGRIAGSGGGDVRGHLHQYGRSRSGGGMPLPSLGRMRPLQTPLFSATRCIIPWGSSFPCS